MGVRFLHVAIACGVAAAWSVVQAAPCALVPSGDATLEGVQRAELLRNGDFVKLEAELDRALKQAGKGGRTDLHVLRDLVDLHQLSGRDISLTQAWVELRPQSFFAQLAMGLAYAEQSTYARGERSAAQTSGGQMSEMQRLNQLAEKHLRQAAQLNPRSALPYNGLLQIAAQEGRSGEAGVQQQLQAANRADPANLGARSAAVRYLAPRWGGSFEQLDAMVQDAKPRLPADQWHYLSYNVVLEKASHAEVIERDKQAAAALYREALEMCSNSQVARQGLGRTR